METIGIPRAEVAERTPAIIELTFEDPSELCSGPQPFEGEMNQIEAGPMKGRAVGLRGDGLDVWVYSIDRATQSRSAQTTDQLILTAPIALGGGALHNGRPVADGEFFAYVPGRENTERVPAGIFLDVQVDAASADARGWRGGMGGRVSPEVHARIRRYCEHRLSAADTGAALPGDADFVRYVADLFDEGALLARPRSEQHRHHRLVRSAIEFMESSMEAPVSVPDVAARLGVSERTLYDAFRSEVGAGPHHYLRLRRLNRFRRMLVRAPRKHGAIARAAAEVGFPHLGDLGRFYKRHFGETPRDTLRRTATATST